MGDVNRLGILTIVQGYFLNANSYNVRTTFGMRQGNSLTEVLGVLYTKADNVVNIRDTVNIPTDI